MPKKNIHPEMYEITVTKVNGEKIKCFSTVKGDLSLESDMDTHPAWQQDKSGADAAAGTSHVKKFNAKYNFDVSQFTDTATEEN
mgnify:CR=1 FL=1